MVFVGTYSMIGVAIVSFPTHGLAYYDRDFGVAPVMLNFIRFLSTCLIAKYSRFSRCESFRK